MKTLLLLRHGKSAWNQAVPDRDRPLKGRGKRASARMGEELRNRDLLPDLIVSSTAKRARSTAKCVRKASGYAGKTLKTEELYMTGVERHLKVLAGVDDSHQRVLLVGHNPDLEELARQLTGQAVTLPTAALACIDLAIESWSQAAEAKGELRFVLLPSESDGSVG
jgi:phosphohistidine phosphatase